jgi:hypothetical protein
LETTASEASCRQSRTKAPKEEITKTKLAQRERNKSYFIVNEDLLEKMKSLAYWDGSN